MATNLDKNGVAWHPRLEMKVLENVTETQLLAIVMETWFLFLPRLDGSGSLISPTVIRCMVFCEK